MDRRTCHRLDAIRWQEMHNPLPLPGAVVWIRRRRWRVEHARADRAVLRLDVSGRDQRVTFLSPFDQFAIEGRRSRWRRVRRQCAVARVFGLAANVCGLDGLPAAVNARLDILPHQLAPALAVAAGKRRVLIADEVGLGKTVQAGLILAELARAEPALKGLILVPAALKLQWRDELERRFAIHAVVVDRTSLAAETRVGRFGEEPWDRPGIWIASFDYLKQPQVLASLPRTPWDVVVIDEAHEVCGDSDRYAACHEAASCARRVVTLTATPHSGEAARFARLLGIGKLEAPVEADDLVSFRRTRRAAGIESTRRTTWLRVRPSELEAAALDALLTFERTALKRSTAAGSRDAALLLLSVFRKRALSTMAALAMSLDRRLAWLEQSEQAADIGWRQPALFSDEIADEIAGPERLSLQTPIGMSPKTERAWVGRALTLARRAIGTERKVRRLERLLLYGREPAIVFTEFRHTLAHLARILGKRCAVAVLHGGQTTGEQQHALEAFRNGRARVLLATDVGAQGLNLQDSSRWVINFELPWNPARIEQRFGRVDRIGQCRRAHGTLLVSAHPTESGLLARLSSRVLAARRAVGAHTLELAVPPEAMQVAAALLAAAPEPDAQAAAPVLAANTGTSKWERRARAVARSLCRRRRFASRWRQRDQPSGRPAAAHGLRGISAPVLIFRVPLVDRTGRVLEVAMAAVRASPALGLRALNFLDARDLIDRMFCARCARVQRMLTSRDRSLADVERALAAHLRSRVPHGGQAQLFGDADARAISPQQRLADVARQTKEEGSVADSDVRIGQPELQIVLLPRS